MTGRDRDDQLQPPLARRLRVSLECLAHLLNDRLGVRGMQILADSQTNRTDLEDSMSHTGTNLTGTGNVIKFERCAKL